MRRRCGEGCSSGSGSNAIECGNNTTTAHLNQTPHHTLDLSRTSLGMLKCINSLQIYINLIM